MPKDNQQKKKSMKKTFFRIVVIFAMFLAGVSPVAAEQEIVPPDVPVRVQYQTKSEGSSWMTARTSLQGTVTESMMLNQLGARYPRAQIRILSASWGRNVSYSVRYQMRRGNAPWTPAPLL